MLIFMFVAFVCVVVWHRG